MTVTTKVWTDVLGLKTAVVTPLTASYTLVPADSGTFLRSDASSPITVTVPSSMAEGATVAIPVWGTGMVTIAAASGATNRSSITVSSAQYAILSILVVKNSTGSSAEFVVGEQV